VHLICILFCIDACSVVFLTGGRESEENWRNKHKEQQGDFNIRFEKSWRTSAVRRTVQLKLLLQLLGLLLTILNLDKEQVPCVPLQVKSSVGMFLGP